MIRGHITGILLVMAAVGQAQEQPRAGAVPESGAIIRSETRVVLVDAVVTNKKGEYVHDLTAKDFKVWEDNKEQTINSFSFEAGVDAPSNVKTHYVVLFFDNSTMDFGAQAQARQAAAKFIDANIGPRRMMAIVNFGGALQIAQNFTSDAERLKAVVSGTKFSSVAPNGDPSTPQLSHAAADFGARDMILALRSLAKNLNSISGRKALILFTSGFPLTEEQLSEVTATIDVCNRSNVAVYPIDGRGLGSGKPLAGLGGVPFGELLQLGAYAPSARSMAFFQRGGPPAGGGGGRPSGGAPAPAPPPGGGRPPAPAPVGGRPPTSGPTPTPGPRPVNGNPGVNRTMGNMPLPGQNQARTTLIPKMPEMTLANENVMYMLADGTGGFVIRNTNDFLAGMQKIGKELDEYYLIGYTPPESKEGTCHALRVKVDQGATVRARTGYCNSKPQDVLTSNQPVEKALESRMAAAQAGSVAASMQAPFFYTGSNVARVNVAMEIPAGSLKFEKQKGKFSAELDVLGIAYKPDGSVAARFSDTVKPQFEDKKEMEEFEKQPFHYENQFDVASGKYNLKVVFSSGGNFGKLEEPLNIDPWENTQFTVSGLALSKQVVQQTDLAASLDSSLLEDRTPLVAQGVQMVPSGSNKFARTGLALFYVEIYEPLLAKNDPSQKPAVAIQFRLLDRKSGTEKFDTGLMRVDIPEKTNNPMIPLGQRMPVKDLAPGQYVLELQAMNNAGATVKRTADFDLE